MSTAAEDIPKLLDFYSAEARAIENQLIQIVWFMRGGITHDQSFRMTNLQKDLALTLIEENIENTKKAGVMMH